MSFLACALFVGTFTGAVYFAAHAVLAWLDGKDDSRPTTIEEK